MDIPSSAQRRVRPRFDLSVQTGAEEALGRIRRYLDRADFGCRGWVAPPYAELEVQAATKHFWSPRLAIYADDADVDRDACTLHCRFQPEPNVWTMYMAAWGMLAVAAACCVAWVCACVLIGNGTTTPLLCLTGFGVAGLALYMVAFTGHRLGREQMASLRVALHEALATSDAATPGSVR
ncbi:MAG: hypothetical protein AAF721_21490 [Myxococcota bacterium]